MIQEQHWKEWEKSAIHPHLIDLNQVSLFEEEAIAEWYFQFIPRSERRNDGRISEGLLKAYQNPLKGGWGILGYDPTNLDSEPELRGFKPDYPRIDKEGKAIKYDFPKNAKHYPIFTRVSYYIACLVCRKAGLDFLAVCQQYQPETREFEEAEECRWFWQFILDHPKIPISYCEGGKKSLSLLSQGRCAIAFTSITTWRAEKGSEKIHPWVEYYAQGRKSFIVFDQDEKPKTIRAVNQQAFALGKALGKAGATRVKRLSWSGTAKGIDDFLYNLSKQYGESYAARILGKCYRAARSYIGFGTDRALPGKIKSIDKKYLKITDLGKDRNARILVIKSPKGSNKTGILADLVESDRVAGIPTISISPIQRLAKEIAERVGVPYRTDSDTRLRHALGYSLCWDSFSPGNKVPFLPEQWEDSGIVLDEFTQGLEHLAFGNTEISKSRPLIAATLGKKLADCWANNKPIRLADADADLESIELIYELIQTYSEEEVIREELEAETITLVNNYQVEKGEVIVYNEPSPRQIRAELILNLENKENLFVFTSSQKPKSKDSTINLEKLALQYYKPEEVLRIDKDSVRDPKHLAFELTGEKLTQLVKKKSIKLVIASPIICTGISIDNLKKYFVAIFDFQSGNLTPNSVRQQAARLRDFKIPIHLWCPRVGKEFIGISRSTNPIELIAEEKAQAKSSFNLLGYREAERLLTTSIAPLQKYWARVGARRNSENYYYRETVIYQFEQEGRPIKVITPTKDQKQAAQEVWLERGEIQKGSVQEAIAKTVAAENIGRQEAKALEKKSCLTDREKDQLDKFNLKQKYGVEEVSQELAEADNNQLYPRLRLNFWLTTGRKYLEDNDRAELKELEKNSRGDVFLPDWNKKPNILKVKILELLRLDRFKQPKKEWHNNLPELIGFKRLVLKYLVQINQVLRCGIAKIDSPIVVAQKLLGTIGEKLPFLRKIRDNGKRLRIYGAAVSKFALSHQQEKEIFNYWLSNAQKRFESLDSKVIPLRVPSVEELRSGTA